ncbi:U11 U12 small nuclear ribonucleo 25 kDa [Olea europaea subsp. europaea]|uniref:U11 U12 small nuclear ribonucleo 25 kDa n=1 Tax=Olea europaea subsp. europaea TaxID=158383 RepID=A0A8S0VGR7_OLEEU|nr:U11 U12 small nuclear ribonucleo 25 kDa [Olea europaea subsp. europaea]
MDASASGTTADDAAGAASAANTGPEYNASLVKKAKLQSTMAALLNDPILSDVTKNPTLSDVDTLINLELGSAMRICVVKMDGTSVDVAVMNSATVKDLKLAIKKKVNDMEETRMGHRHISWYATVYVDFPGKLFRNHPHCFLVHIWGSDKKP